MAEVITFENYDNYISSGNIHSAVINVTDACNLRCKYCFTQPNPRTMSLDTAKAIIRFLMKEQDTHFAKVDGDKEFMMEPSVYFFGGEPMLGFDSLIKPLIEWMKETGITEKYKFHFGITSNGTLLNEEKSRYLYENKVGLLLSIDGAPETQDLQRPTVNGGKSSPMILYNLPTILKYWPEVTFRSTVEPYTAHKLFENYMWAREKGFVSYYVIPNAFQKWEPETIKELLLNLTKIENIMIRDILEGYTPLIFSDLIRECKHIFESALVPGWNNPSLYATTQSLLKRCGLGVGSIGVAVDGKISGCQERNTHLDDEDPFYIGDVFNGIDKKRHINLLNLYLGETTHCNGNGDRCKSCSRLIGCKNNNCIARNWDTGKSFNAISEITCIWLDFMKKSMELLLMEVNKDEKDAKCLTDFFVKYFDTLAGKEVVR